MGKLEIHSINWYFVGIDFWHCVSLTQTLTVWRKKKNNQNPLHTQISNCFDFIFGKLLRTVSQPRLNRNATLHSTLFYYLYVRFSRQYLSYFAAPPFAQFATVFTHTDNASEKCSRQAKRRYGTRLTLSRCRVASLLFFSIHSFSR